MTRSAALFILLLIPVLAFCETDTDQYGAIAGAVYPPMDAASLTGYIILTPLVSIEGDTALQRDKSASPIYIRRMFKGQFYVDSIPAGQYDAAINGVAYDSSFNLLARCIEQKLTGFRVAPDSVSIVAHRLVKNHSDKRQSRRMNWVEQIRPDTAAAVRIRGQYNDVDVYELYLDLTLPREGYRFTLEANRADSAEIDGLTLAVFSNRFYDGRENELGLGYNIAGDTIIIDIDPQLLPDASVDYWYRQPLYHLTNIPFLESCRHIRFTGSDTTVFDLSFDADMIEITVPDDRDAETPREVYYYSNNTYVD